jgi:hypothetical protein
MSVSGNSIGPTIMSEFLYLGDTELDESCNILPKGNGWKIHLKPMEDGRYSLAFTYFDADKVDHVVTEM